MPSKLVGTAVDSGLQVSGGSVIGVPGTRIEIGQVGVIGWRQKKMPPPEGDGISCFPVGRAYAICASSGLRRRVRRIATPAAPKPTSIIAQVAGSGTGGVFAPTAGVMRI